MTQASKSRGAAELEDTVTGVATVPGTATVTTVGACAAGGLIGSGTAGAFAAGGLVGSGTVEEPAGT